MYFCRYVCDDEVLCMCMCRVSINNKHTRAVFTCLGSVPWNPSTLLIHNAEWIYVNCSLTESVCVMLSSSPAGTATISLAFSSSARVMWACGITRLLAKSPFFPGVFQKWPCSGMLLICFSRQSFWLCFYQM